MNARKWKASAALASPWIPLRTSDSRVSYFCVRPRSVQASLPSLGSAHSSLGETSSLSICVWAREKGKGRALVRVLLASSKVHLLRLVCSCAHADRSQVWQRTTAVTSTLHPIQGDTSLAHLVLVLKLITRIKAFFLRLGGGGGFLNYFLSEGGYIEIFEEVLYWERSSVDLPLHACRPS